MTNTAEDQWSSSYLGDDTSRVVDVCDTSAGGRLRLLCSGEYELAVQAAEGNPQLLEELELWEKQFPSLVVKGTKIPIKRLSSTHDEATLGTRMMIARRIVLNYILPDLQKVFQAEFPYSKSLPKLKKGGRSKSSIIPRKRESKATVTLPFI